MLLSPVSHITPNAAALAGASAAFAPPCTLPAPWLRIRRLGQDDRAALTRHLVGLPLADRCTRFGGPSSDEAIRRHCDALDLGETICFAALDGNGAVVGAALGFSCGAGDGRRGSLVEVAVSVDPEHRGHGLGADLAARVCATAAVRGATGAVFEFTRATPPSGASSAASAGRSPRSRRSA